jgi:hypothetical protein
MSDIVSKLVGLFVLTLVAVIHALFGLRSLIPCLPDGLPDEVLLGLVIYIHIVSSLSELYIIEKIKALASLDKKL